MKTLKKGLAVLNTFTENVQSQGVTEIANKLGFHKSTTYNLLKTLLEEGYVIIDLASKKYSLGYMPLDLATRITYRKDLRDISQPIMQELSKKCEEDVALNILVEGRSVTIAVVESQYFIRSIIPLGKPYPLHCRAAGKVIMAYLSKKEITDTINRYGLPKYTSKTITEKNKLLIELDKIRQNKFADSCQEFGPEGISLAFPIFNKNQKIIASVSIHSTINRLNEKKRNYFIIEGLKQTNRINKILSTI